MESQEIINELKKLSSVKYKSNVMGMGITVDASLGVSISNLEKLEEEY